MPLRTYAPRSLARCGLAAPERSAIHFRQGFLLRQGYGGQFGLTSQPTTQLFLSRQLHFPRRPRRGAAYSAHPFLLSVAPLPSEAREREARTADHSALSFPSVAFSPPPPAKGGVFSSSVSFVSCPVPLGGSRARSANSRPLSSSFGYFSSHWEKKSNCGGGRCRGCRGGRGIWRRCGGRRRGLRRRGLWRWPRRRGGGRGLRRR